MQEKGEHREEKGNGKGKDPFNYGYPFHLKVMSVIWTDLGFRGILGRKGILLFFVFAVNLERKRSIKEAIEELIKVLIAKVLKGVNEKENESIKRIRRSNTYNLRRKLRSKRNSN